MGGGGCGGGREAVFGRPFSHDVLNFLRPGENSYLSHNTFFASVISHSEIPNTALRLAHARTETQ